MPKVVELSKVPKFRTGPTYLRPPKNPLSAITWVDGPLRCASRGCSSPTYCKVEGIPYCMKHSLDKMDEIIVKLRGGTDEELTADQLL